MTNRLPTIMDQQRSNETRNGKIIESSRENRRSGSLNPNLSGRSSSKDSTYTPPWLSPQERARMRARVSRLRTAQEIQKKKEEQLLLKGREGSVESKRSKRSKSRASQKGESGSPARSVEPSLPPVPSEGSVKSRHMEKKKSKESMKKKSNASLQSKDSNELRKPKSKGVSKKQHTTDKNKSNESMRKNKSNESMRKIKSNESMREKSDRSLQDYESNDLHKTKSKTNTHKPHQSKDYKMQKKRKQPTSSTYPSGNTMASKEEREFHANILEDHIWVTDYADFDPQLYHFKSPEKLSTKSPASAECPPFWVLLDHTIAIIWKLFNEKSDRRFLGIIPLQWSLEFVTAMKDERGGYLPAISRVKSAIEDALIDRYAKAADKDQDESKIETPEASRAASAEGISYVSSESIFKYSPEVSYTLKDILSRDIPGRRPLVEEPPKHRVVPADRQTAPPPDQPPMDINDMMSYLRHLKMEQEARVQKEKERAEKIDALMKLAATGEFGPEMLSYDRETAKKQQSPDRVKFGGRSASPDKRDSPEKTPRRSNSNKATRKPSSMRRGSQSSEVSARSTTSQASTGSKKSQTSVNSRAGRGSKQRKSPKPRNSVDSGIEDENT